MTGAMFHFSCQVNAVERDFGFGHARPSDLRDASAVALKPTEFASAQTITRVVARV
jgi:hypothetical protein